VKKILAVTAILSAVCPAAFAQEGRDPLLTRPGLEVGAQAAHYHYEEPGVAKLIGLRAGGVGAFTFMQGDAFFKADGRISLGSLNYQGSGTRSGVPDFILEGRFVAGADLKAEGDVVFSPYAGLGYRYLYNDLRGYTRSGGALYAGYRRYSTYLYAPLGLTLRTRLDDGWVLAPTLEYDVFLRGMQISTLSDIGGCYRDITNTQTGGSGYRAAFMAEKGHLAFGPWLHYWNIKDALDPQPDGCGKLRYEPHNWTREIGFEVRYRF
jgi:hypothetical protein